MKDIKASSGAIDSLEGQDQAEDVAFEQAAHNVEDKFEDLSYSTKEVVISMLVDGAGLTDSDAHSFYDEHLENNLSEVSENIDSKTKFAEYLCTTIFGDSSGDGGLVVPPNDPLALRVANWAIEETDLDSDDDLENEQLDFKLQGSEKATSKPKDEFLVKKIILAVSVVLIIGIAFLILVLSKNEGAGPSAVVANTSPMIVGDSVNEEPITPQAPLKLTPVVEAVTTNIKPVVQPSRTARAIEVPSTSASAVDQKMDKVISDVGEALVVLNNKLLDISDSQNELQLLVAEISNEQVALSIRVKNLDDTDEIEERMAELDKKVSEIVIKANEKPVVINRPAQKKVISPPARIPGTLSYCLAGSTNGVAYIKRRTTKGMQRIEVGDRLIGYGPIVSISEFGVIITKINNSEVKVKIESPCSY
jgi:hypothetical protein